MSEFSADPNAIVTVNVSTVQAPTPSKFQQQGSFVTFGGTTLASGTTKLITQAADLTQIRPSIQVTSVGAYGSGVVVFTVPSGSLSEYTNGDTPEFFISGFTPGAYNGGYTATILSSTTFSIPYASDPGTATVVGKFQPTQALDLQGMVNTFFAQGRGISVSVLELGYHATVADCVTAFTTWLTDNPLTFYGFLLPRDFGYTASETAVKALLNLYNSPDAMVFFWMTTTLASHDDYDATYTCLVKGIESPTGRPNTEFTLAAMFYQALVFKPSNTNRIAPMAFKYLYGVTPYPVAGNSAQLVDFKTTNTNYVATGAEGGISFNMVYPGTVSDGTDYFNWWWTIDNTAINIKLDVSNAIINGSNNPLAPLYYDQPGINTLQGVLQATMSGQSQKGMVNGAIKLTQYDGPTLTDAINSGKFAGLCNINAVPFLPYSLANPGDYKIGEYDGLSVLFIPSRGFVHVAINLVASELISV